MLSADFLLPAAIVACLAIIFLMIGIKTLRGDYEDQADE